MQANQQLLNMSNKKDEDDNLSSITYYMCQLQVPSRMHDQTKTGHISEPMRFGFCDNSIPTISDIFSNADDSLFKTILKNSYHVLYPYLQENQYQHYHLRQRPHNKALLPKTTYLSDRDYIMHMLYKNCY